MFFEAQASGLTPANWEEKAIKIEGKEKNAGYLGGTEPGLLTKNPIKLTAVTIEAESTEEAIKALTVFYGRGVINGKCIAAKTSGLKEEFQAA